MEVVGLCLDSVSSSVREPAAAVEHLERAFFSIMDEIELRMTILSVQAFLILPCLISVWFLRLLSPLLCPETLFMYCE